MFVPPQVEQLVKAAGIEGHKLVGTQGIGGSRVIQHWDLADDKNKAKPALTTGEVDVFTMAAHVAIPDEGITKFTELGLKHNPNLRLLVQASWFPFDVPEPDKRISENAQRDNAKIADLQQAVDDWRKKLEAQVDDLNKQHGKTGRVHRAGRRRGGEAAGPDRRRQVSRRREAVGAVHRPDRPRRRRTCRPWPRTATSPPSIATTRGPENGCTGAGRRRRPARDPAEDRLGDRFRISVCRHRGKAAAVK